MTTTQLTMKSRGPRITEAQISAMLDYIESNRSLATGKFPGINGRDELRSKWTALSDHLNMITGAKKSSAQWQVTWRDLKSRTSIKIRNSRNGRAATGNKPITEAELTATDERVVGLIGNSYVEGSQDCPDSTPEEQGLIDRLVDGDDTALLEEPVTLSCFASSIDENDLHEKKSSNVQDIQFDTASSVLDNDLAAETFSSSVEVPRIRKRVAKAQIAACAAKRPSNRTRISTQLHDSKEEFAQISRQHANAMEKISDAMKMQAEASLIAANAAQRQADVAVQQAANDAARVEVFKQLTQVLSELLPQYTT